MVGPWQICLTFQKKKKKSLLRMSKSVSRQKKKKINQLLSADACTMSLTLLGLLHLFSTSDVFSRLTDPEFIAGQRCKAQLKCLWRTCTDTWPTVPGLLCKMCAKYASLSFGKFHVALGKCCQSVVVTDWLSSPLHSRV